MPHASPKTKKPANSPRDNGSGGGPSVSDRAASGVRIAGHIGKAAAGGKLRRGFSLWRASRELPVAAAGATDLFRRHPIPIALLGGALTTAGLLYAARAMGAFEPDEEGGEAATGETDPQDEADNDIGQEEGGDE